MCACHPGAAASCCLRVCAPAPGRLRLEAVSLVQLLCHLAYTHSMHVQVHNGVPRLLQYWPSSCRSGAAVAAQLVDLS